MRHSGGVTYLLDARDGRRGPGNSYGVPALPLPPCYREDTPTECCNPTHCPWVGFSEFRTVSLADGIQGNIAPFLRANLNLHRLKSDGIAFSST